MQATAESEFAGRDGSLTGAGTYSLRDGSLLKDGAGTYPLEGSEGEESATLEDIAWIINEGTSPGDRSRLGTGAHRGAVPEPEWEEADEWIDDDRDTRASKKQ